MRYTSVIAFDFLSQHLSPNHGLWEAKSFSTYYYYYDYYYYNYYYYYDYYY